MVLLYTNAGGYMGCRGHAESPSDEDRATSLAARIRKNQKKAAKRKAKRAAEGRSRGKGLPKVR